MAWAPRSAPKPVDVPSVLSDVVVATRDNMMDTVIRDGFHARQEVYGAAP